MAGAIELTVAVREERVDMFESVPGAARFLTYPSLILSV